MSGRHSPVGIVELDLTGRSRATSVKDDDVGGEAAESSVEG